MAWQLRKVIENKKEEYIMQDKSKVIFNNEIDRKAYRKAINSKKKYARKYGDDSNADYKVTIKKNKYIGDMLGVYDVRVADKPASVSNGNKEEFDTDKGIIVGNIRMGFGHYRISMAIASAANALGYVPYWMDLNSYDNTTCTKVIRAQNDLYSLGSRLSQKSWLFNRLVWEPITRVSGSFPITLQTRRMQSLWHLYIRMFLRIFRLLQLMYGRHRRQYTQV